MKKKGKSTKPRIGFIGLGIMGKPMALNLIKANYPLSVYARRPEILKSLPRTGTTIYETPKELAKNVDVIITIVGATSDGSILAERLGGFEPVSAENVRFFLLGLLSLA